MDKSNGLGPVVQRRRLRGELRRIRQETGETQEQVAVAMDWSLSKLIRIENGTVGISTNDLKVLLRHYGAKDDQTEELVALAKAARERSWWRAYSNVAAPRLFQFIEYQAAASHTRNFEPLLVPGLLQTEEYAREVLKEFNQESSKDRLDALVAIRMKRQELLKQSGPSPRFFFILNEGVLHRVVGDKDVMARQIHHLIELASRDNVTVEVVPSSAGVHRGMHGPFVILEFSESEDDEILYMEIPQGEWINRDDPEEILGYREIFEELRHISLGEGTQEFLRTLLDEMWSYEQATLAATDPIPVQDANSGHAGAGSLTGTATIALPWERLDDEGFERLLYDLLRGIPEYEDVKWLIHTHAADRGRDISLNQVVRDSTGSVRNERMIVQAKHWLKKSVKLTDVSDTASSIKLWEPPVIRRLVIATSGRFTQDAVAWAEKHNEAYSARSI